MGTFFLFDLDLTSFRKASNYLRGEQRIASCWKPIGKTISVTMPVSTYPHELSALLEKFATKNMKEPR